MYQKKEFSDLIKDVLIIDNTTSAVLQGYTGDPNEVRPGYKLRASPVHITFSTGYVPPGFFTRLATAVATDASVKLNFENDYAYAVPATGFFDRILHRTSKVEIKSIYRNRVCFSYGRPSDDFVLTDINEAIQVDVLRYAPESSHPVSLKLVCQKILKMLDECCQQVEDTLSHYHGHHPNRSSRQVQYVCQCSPSSDVHYINDIDAMQQTSSDYVYCKLDRRSRHLNNEESMWFKDNMSQEKQLQEIPPLKEIIIKDDRKPTIQKTDSTTNYSATPISESNDDQHKVILNIKNLVDIIQVLKTSSFQTIKWFDLGLYLGLIHYDLKVIETNYPQDAERCLKECLAKWLTDDIEAKWETLAIAADTIGEKRVAEYINEIIINNK
ncbi:PREDICTED: uncharacterized protein LOC109581374 [Amphimedon queenslandica]|uniref:Death domain-containing protein n=1 Tax=Amphimedon queenslandica TaxID=400682 RepID=A0AAN0J1T4_AMPQE|nr:PREDICTED: uncharacterized protein LOC109581374 [Amphimedon queenslandica]|eukprot:XP_019850999.1 PREDICTED: uncharacterized protein LOC109581374 [Amphimedon queenslandica]